MASADGGEVVTAVLLDPGNSGPEQWAGDPIDAGYVAELVDLGHRALAAELVEPVDWTPEQRNLLTLMPARAGETCSPAIAAEMSEWLDLGGENSGCVGNQAHDRGFHRGASFVPETDYSRRRDPNGADGPFSNWSWSCAGDFRHAGNPALRNLHRLVLAQLMAGGFPMICEMIVQPDPTGPVMYWARWEGVGRLREYTGVGHDLWSHLSWTRSRADERPYLWRQAVAITEADVKKFFSTDGALTNRAWRADIATNPMVSANSTLSYTWDDAHFARVAAEQVKAEVAKMQLTLAAILSAAKGADDGAAVIAAVTAKADELKVDFARQLAAVQADELARDTANMADLFNRVAALGQGGVTADMLLTAMRQVYGEAFTRAVQANADTLDGEVVARALGQ